MRTLAIARNTFQEAVRDKVLFVLLFFAAAAIIGSKALGWVSMGQDIKIIKDISLASISVFGVLIAIFVGTNLVYKEIDKRTIYTIICCPIHRYEFVLGKYFGLAALLALVVAAMTGVAALYIFVMGGELHAVFFIAALLIYVQLLLVTAFAVLLSSLTSPILGAIIVFSFYVLGNAVDILNDLPPQLEGTTAEAALIAAYRIVPNLTNFDIKAQAANGVAVAPGYIAWVLLYGLIYTAGVLVFAVLAFEDKDV